MYNSIHFDIPEDIYYILDRLQSAGYDAYIVGGAVRDMLMHNKIHDYDIASAATPEEVEKVFSDLTILETGLKHGTVTLRLHNESYEITTFRTDGDYSDNRHPDKVEFVRNIEKDLSRRDLTINAIAYSPAKGLLDPYGGWDDIKSHTINTVGDADKRFQEDALRILRTIRFASRYDFHIDDSVKAAILRNKSLLQNVSAERKCNELSQILTNDYLSFDLLYVYHEVFFELIPELRPAYDFNQHNPHHIYTVYDHIMHSVVAAPAILPIRLAMLLHDIAKPQTFSVDADGIGHFFGHAEKSANMARQILRRLRFDNQTIHTVTTLISYHDYQISPSEKAVRKLLNKIGFDTTAMLLMVQYADHAAQSQFTSDAIRFEENRPLVAKTLHEIMIKQQAFSLKDLAVNGYDIMAAGIPTGKPIGIILNRILEDVLEHPDHNSKEFIMSRLNTFTESV